MRPYGWAPLVALAATQALELGERQALSQAVEGIKDAFAVSDLAAGLLPTAVTVVGVLAAIPMGSLTDRRVRTRLVAIGVLVWTAGALGAGLAPTFALLFGARLLLGAMEAAAPPSVALLADYYPVQERAKVMGFYQGGALVGGLLGLVGGGLAVSAGNWRWAFLVWVPAGVVVAFFVSRLREPTRGESDARAHLDDDMHEEPAGEKAAAVPAVPSAPAPTGGDDDISLREALRRLAGIRTFWLALVAIGLAQLLLTALQFWGVPFFRRVHDLSPTEAGGLTALLGLGAAIGILGGGMVADRFVGRGIVNARIYAIAIGAIGTSLVLVPAFASTSLAITTPLFVLGGIFLTLPIAPAEAVIADVVVAKLRGRSSAIRSVVRGLSQTGPLLVGALSTAVGLQQALVYFAPVYALGGLIVLLALRTYRHDLEAVIEASRDRIE